MKVLGGRYRMVERVGAGGMSVVWRGFDLVLGRQVAVKVLDAALATDPVLRRRIRIEAQAAARLSHPHITNVYDYGESDGAPYVVMELVDGESLAAILGRDRVLPWPQAVTVCAQVASALAAAHERGVVHRDVTPGNVMLTAAGVKVVDFGISALVGEREVGPDGTLLGTPAYLAPERLDGGPVSPATDVYAVGILLYRAVTGRLPWPAASTTQTLRAHRHTDPDPLPAIDGLPDTVVRLYQRCLAKSPDARPTSAEVAEILAAAAPASTVALPVGVHGGPAMPRTTILPAATAAAMIPPPPRPRRWWRPAAGAPRRPPVRQRAQAVLLGAGLLALTGLLWTNADRSPDAGAGATGEAAPAPAVTTPGPAACRVGYALRQDSGAAFRATVVVTNTGSRPRKQWRLTFAFPAGQRLAPPLPPNVTQHDRQVTVRPVAAGQELPPGGSATLDLAGTYDRTNPLPVAFTLDGAACDAVVSGVNESPPATAPALGNARTGGTEPDNSGKGSSGNSGKGKGNGKGKKD
ncbi:serine/threonine-protein kinase [Actinomycetes bacterium KLBMP 9797]